MLNAVVTGVPGRARRTVTIAGLLALALVMSTLAPLSAQAAPTIGGTDPVSYTEQDPATPIAPNLTLSGGTAYGGQYIEFEITSGAASETLALSDDGVASTTLGAVSVVGSSVYLGNGVTADIIGSVDGTFDGTSGSKLRVNFTSDFQNAGFETGDLTGWTALNFQVDLGVTSIAGCTTSDTSTYPIATPNQDNNTPSSLGTLTSTAVGAGGGFTPSEGSYSARLQSSGMVTAQGYDVVHGPAILSSPFEAAAGDTIYFDWRAYAGADDYHVFGYIVDGSCNQTELLDATGPGTTAWATVPTVIPASGTYRFVFVSGTFDASGGRAAGASLYIDNVQVFGNKVTDAVAQAVARKVTYHNSSDNPPSSRTVTVTAQSVAQGSGNGSITINITAVDDGPSLATPSTATYTNTIANEDFTDATGTLIASDPEGDAITLEIVGGSAYGGPGYDQSITGTYGTLLLDTSDGDYRFVPDDAAINARTSDDTETFTMRASNGGGSDDVTFTVEIDIPASVPGAPTGLGATPGDGEVDLSWIAPAWLGGSSITDYVIQYSDDGGSTWSTFADGTSTGTTATVTGLTNGTEYTFVVAAVNATGTGPVSSPVTATPLGAQAALSVNVSDFTYGSTTPLATTGGSGGGAVTYNVVSGPCQVTGSTLSATGAGTCSITATKAGDGSYAAITSPAVTVEVATKGLSITGATVVSKVYDGTTTAVIDGATLSGAESGDDVSLANATAGVFASAAVGEDISVDPSWALSGADAANYHLVEPVLSGDIVPAPTVAVSAPAQGGDEYEPGDEIEAEICNLQPGSTVEGTLDGDGATFGPWTVGEDGCVIITATLPTDADPGTHVLSVNVTNLAAADEVLNLAIEVAGDTASTLPLTGLEAEGYVWLIVLLVEVGLIVLGLNRFDLRMASRKRTG